MLTKFDTGSVTLRKDVTRSAVRDVINIVYTLETKETVRLAFNGHLGSHVLNCGGAVYLQLSVMHAFITFFVVTHVHI